MVCNGGLGRLDFRLSRGRATPKPLILLVERQAPMRRALRRVLGEIQFDWAELDGGEALFAAAQRLAPAAVLLEDQPREIPCPVAIRGLRAVGCGAPIVLLANRMKTASDLPLGLLRDVWTVDRCAVIRLRLLLPLLLALPLPLPLSRGLSGSGGPPAGDR